MKSIVFLIPLILFAKGEMWLKIGYGSVSHIYGTNGIAWDPKENLIFLMYTWVKIIIF